MNKKVVLALAFCFFGSSVTHAKMPIEIPKNEIKIPKKEIGLWIDVRTEEEYKEGHIKGAIHIPYDQIAEKITKYASNKKQPIHVYCKSGRRAEIALQALKKMGYENVTNQGGYADLKAKGIQ